jgi:hypothetical protein
LGLLSVDLINLKILLHKMTFVPGIVTLLSGVVDSNQKREKQWFLIIQI